MVCEYSNGQCYFHSHDFDVMRMIGQLIDSLEMLENQFGNRILRTIAPEHVPSKETAKNNDTKEDKDDVKEDN